MDLASTLSIDEKSPSGLRWNNGKVAGCLRVDGYWRLRYQGKQYYNHRVVAVLAGKLESYGSDSDIDHIDGDRGNNKLDNLRAVDRLTNNINMKCHRNGKKVGASYHPKKDSWQSRITISGTRVSLGYFKTEQEAHEAYLKKYEELYGKRP